MYIYIYIGVSDIVVVMLLFLMLPMVETPDGFHAVFIREEFYRTAYLWLYISIESITCSMPCSSVLHEELFFTFGREGQARNTRRVGRHELSYFSKFVRDCLLIAWGLEESGRW